MADNKEAPKAKKEKTEKPEGESIVHAHTTRAKTKSSWTLEKCKKFARRFKSETEWAQGSPSSYKSAQAHGWVAQCMGNTKSIRKVG